MLLGLTKGTMLKQRSCSRNCNKKKRVVWPLNLDQNNDDAIQASTSLPSALPHPVPTAVTRNTRHPHAEFNIFFSFFNFSTTRHLDM